MLTEEMKSPDADERFQHLFQRHYGDIHAYCSRRIGHSDADDVAAEVFATAWRRFDDIEWRTVEPWLYGIARRVLANRWRSVRRRNELTQRIAGLAASLPDSPEVQVVRRDVDELVTNALGRLRASDREILMLAAWEELSAAEIAGALSVSTSAAEQRLHRAKVRFATALDHASSRSRPGAGGAEH
jgi:RNA polymerase sigma-70 factor (ECF subfamily)